MATSFDAWLKDYERAQKRLREAQDVPLVTVPRGWSQSTESALFEAGLDPDDIEVFTGGFTGDPAEAGDDPAIRRELAEVLQAARKDAGREPRPLRREARRRRTARRLSELDNWTRREADAWTRILAGLQPGSSSEWTAESLAKGVEPIERRRGADRNTNRAPAGDSLMAVSDSVRFYQQRPASMRQALYVLSGDPSFLTEDEREQERTSPSWRDELDVHVVPRDWSQSTESALAAAGIDPRDAAWTSGGVDRGQTPAQLLADPAVSGSLEEWLLKRRQERARDARGTLQDRADAVDTRTPAEKAQATRAANEREAEWRQYVESIRERTGRTPNLAEQVADRYTPDGSRNGATADVDQSGFGLPGGNLSEPATSNDGDRQPFWRRILGAAADFNRAGVSAATAGYGAGSGAAGRDRETRERRAEMAEKLADQQAKVQDARQESGLTAGDVLSRGALSTLLENMARPGNFVRGGITGTIEGRDVGVGLSRALAGWGGEQYGFGDLWDDSDLPLAAKVPARAGTFALDVLADPLSYITGGGAGLTRPAAARAAERTVGRAAARATGRELGEAATREGRERLLQNVGDDPAFFERLASLFDDAGIERATGREVRDVLADAGTQSRSEVFDTLRQMGFRVDEEDLLTQGLENLAGGATMRSGTTGLRRQLADVFGSDDVFDALPSPVRGGVHAQVPFLFRRTDYGNMPRYTFGLTSGGGRAPGAEVAADVVNTARTRLRASGAGQGWQSVFGGRSSDALKGASRQVAELPEELAGRGYRIWRDAEELAEKASQMGNAYTRRAVAAATSIDRTLKQEGVDPEGAKEVMRLQMSARGSQDFARQVDAQIAELGLDEATVAAGRQAEALMAAHLDEIGREAADLFGPERAFNLLNTYTPRRVLQDLVEDVPGKGSKTKHSRHRSGAYARYEIDPETGQLRVASWMAPDEANLHELRTLREAGVRAGREAAEAGDEAASQSVRDAVERAIESGRTVQFDTDPTQLLADYTDSMVRLLRAERLVQHLEGTGALSAPGAARTVARIDDRAVRDAAEPAAEAMRTAAERAKALRAAAAAGDRDAVLAELGERAVRRLEAAKPQIGRGIGKAEGKFVVTGDGIDETFDSLPEALTYATKVGTERQRAAMSELVAEATETTLDAVRRDTDALNRLLDPATWPLEDGEAMARHLDDLADTIGRWSADKATPDDFRTARVVANDYRDELVEAGWKSAGEGGDALATRLLAERGVFAPAALADQLERMFKAASPSGVKEAQNFMDAVYQPYYTSFKTLATVGRGPGFAARNVMGGMWNAYLTGARAGHFRRAAQMMRVEQQARQRVLREAAKSGTPIPRTQLEGRLKDAVRQAYVDKWGDDQGSRLFEALDTFYGRNLTMGSRTDDFYMQTYAGAPVTRNAGGPMGDGFDGGEATELSAWERFNWWERGGLPDRGRTSGQVVDDMDPALRRMAGFDNTAFPGTSREDLSGWRSVVQKATDNPWVRANMSLSETSEKYLRLGTFLGGVDQYGLADGGLAAGLTVKASQFDYGDLSEVERRILRNFVPFYTFTRNNIPLQVRSVVSSPDKLQKFNLAWGAIEDTFGDDDFDAGILPEFVRSNLGFATRFSPSDTPGAGVLSKIPGVGRMFDNDYQLALNIGALPLADLENFFRWGPGVRNAGPVNVDEVVNMLNPLFSTTFELSTGVDTFTREELRDTERAPGFMQNRWTALLPGFRERVGGDESEIVVSGPAAHAVREMVPPWGQVERLTGSTDRYEDRMLSSWLSAFGGLPVSTLDDNQLYWNARRLEQELKREAPDERGTWETLRQLLGAGR